MLFLWFILFLTSSIPRLHTKRPSTKLQYWEICNTTEQTFDGNFMEQLYKAISEKVKKLVILRNKMAKIKVKFTLLMTSINRIRSSNRCTNVAFFGIKYSSDMNEIFEQLKVVAKYIGKDLDNKMVRSIEVFPSSQKLGTCKVVVSFFKVKLKQSFLLGYRKASYCKQLGYRKKLEKIPKLPDQEILLQDDLDVYEKKVWYRIKKLQNLYSSFIRCYVKDCRIYYKFVNEIRPNVIDTLSQVQALRSHIMRMIKNKTIIEKKSSIFRSASIFPQSYYREKDKTINFQKT